MISSSAVVCLSLLVSMYSLLTIVLTRSLNKYRYINVPEDILQYKHNDQVKGQKTIVDDCVLSFYSYISIMIFECYYQ